MDVPSTSTAQTEREQLEEDIVRIQLALQSDEDDYGSDYYSEEENTGDTGTGRLKIDTDDDTVQSIDRTLQDTEVERTDLQVQLLGDQVLPVNYETCLALNLAYQELLTETLKKVEQALTENREKQAELSIELENKSVKKLKTIRNIPLAQYAIPYFKAPNGGSRPLPNPDVVSKRIYKELTQNVNTDSTWKVNQRKQLIAAVRNCRNEEVLRPLMNKKEILYEKLTKCDSKREKKEIKEQIKELEFEIHEKQQLSDAELLQDVDVKTIDWLKISVRTFDGKKDALCCQMMWQNVLDPNINCKKWTDGEEERLAELVVEYNNKDWMAISEDLGTNRTPYQCLQHYNMRMNNAFHKKEWTDVEDKMLCEVVESCRMGNRIPWNQVSYYMEGRSGDHCCLRWTQVDPTVRKGKWTVKEDSLLIAAMAVVASKNFHRIAEYVPGRNAVQCRERWTNSLDPKLKLGSWTYEEDKFILESVQRLGRGAWSQIAAEMKNRNDNQILQRFRKLMEWKKKSEWIENQPKEVKLSLQGDVKSLIDSFQMEKTPSDKLKQLEQMMDSRGTIVADYLKQERDRKAGVMVVPRQPLLLKGSLRTFDGRWKRREHLRQIIKKHITHAMGTGHSVTTKDVKAVADTSLADFLKVQDSNILSQDLSNMSVKDMLELTKNISQGNMNMPVGETTKKKPRKKKEKSLVGKPLDSALKNILSIRSSRTEKGRPRKIPWDADTVQNAPADLKKIRQNTTSLLFTSLGVDCQSLGGKIQDRERHRTDSSQRNVNRELQNASSNAGDAEGDDMETTDSVYRSDNEVVEPPRQNESISRNDTPGKVFSLPYQPPNLTTMRAFKILLLQRRRLVSKCDSQKTSKKSKKKLERTKQKSKSIKSEVEDISQPPCSVTAASSIRNHSMSSGINNSHTGGISVDSETGNYFSTSSSTVPPCVRRRQIGNSIRGVVTGDNEITIQGVFDGAVLNNPNVNSSSSEVPQTPALNTTTTSTPQQSEELDAENSPTSKRSADFGPHIIDQLITAAKHDSAYQKLKARFQALFLWPALLSTVYTPEIEDTSHSTKQAKNVDGVASQEQSCSRPPHTDDNSDLQSDEKAASKTRKYPKKARYAMVHGKRFYKTQIQLRKVKEEKQQRRSDMKEARLSGIPYTPTATQPQSTSETDQDQHNEKEESQKPVRKCGRPKGSKNFGKLSNDLNQSLRASSRIAKIKETEQQLILEQQAEEEFELRSQSAQLPMEMSNEVTPEDSEKDEKLPLLKEALEVMAPTVSRVVRKKITSVGKKNKQSIKELTQGFLEEAENSPKRQKLEESLAPLTDQQIVIISEAAKTFNYENNY